MLKYFFPFRSLFVATAAAVSVCNVGGSGGRKLNSSCLRPTFAYLLQNYYFSKNSLRAMSTGKSGGDSSSDEILVGALRRAGISKSPREVTRDEWAKILTPFQFSVLRESHTERAGSGPYLDNVELGNYHCAGCGAVLFTSETKFSSHCGWPSFYAEAKISEGKKEKSADTTIGNVGRRVDNSHGVTRTEIFCKQCNAHLGHVFDDGPPPTNERFCVNGAALEFVPNKK